MGPASAPTSPAARPTRPREAGVDDLRRGRPQGPAHACLLVPAARYVASFSAGGEGDDRLVQGSSREHAASSSPVTRGNFSNSGSISASGRRGRPTGVPPRGHGRYEVSRQDSCTPQTCQLTGFRFHRCGPRSQGYRPRLDAAPGRRWPTGETRSGTEGPSTS
jgi:hypothetical protein